MKPKWLVENFDEESFPKLVEEVRRQGMECKVVEYLPFESGVYNIFEKGMCVIVQASLQLARQLLKEKDWVPNAWLSLENYECVKYYAFFGKYLLNDDYVILPRSEVKRKINDLYECFFSFSTDELFMRPSSGFKTFAGKIFERKHFEHDWSFVEQFTDPESLIIISTPKNIVKEWRFVVVENEVITGSLYKADGKKQLHCVTESSVENYKALFYAQKIIDSVDFRPNPVFVIDICKAGDDKFYLLEIGSFSCAGLYNCDLEKIVTEVSKVAEKEHLSYNDL